jgi:RNA polymerase sigma-70 factor (ECF subfamily)
MEQEQILIQQSQQGNPEAFDQLIKPYESRLYTFLAKMCNNEAAAQDMAQETFINVFKKIKEFRGDAKFSTWIFRIATNNCLMLKRQSAQHTTVSLDDPHKGPPFEIPDWKMTPEKTYAQDELKQIVDGALQKLAPLYRSVFILSEIDGFTGIEITEILNISLPTVKARLRRAKEKLRTILTPSLLKTCCDCQHFPDNAHHQIIKCIRGLGSN